MRSSTHNTSYPSPRRVGMLVLMVASLSPAPLSPAPRSARAKADPAEAQYDAVLVRRFQAGDEMAFAEIVARHRQKAFVIAFARLRSRTDAEEIAQDTFIRAHRALANFRGESSLATWLCRITVNLSLNRYWYFFRRGRHLASSLEQPYGNDSRQSLAEVVASEDPDPVREAMTSEYIQIAADQAAQLSPDQREILQQRNGLNRSYGEIAVALGLKVGTVKSRIARARRNLQALIATSCPEFASDASAAEWFGAIRSAVA